MPSLSTCLWFDTQAEEAVNFYLSVFKDSKITGISRYPESPHEFHRGRTGTVLTVAFEMLGRPFLALNGGPQFHFTEAVSLIVECDSQKEIDYYWEALGAGGPPEAKVCGWLKDKYGLSWQIVPRNIAEMMTSDNTAGQQRLFTALMEMRKLDKAELERAFRGEA